MDTLSNTEDSQERKYPQQQPYSSFTGSILSTFSKNCT